VVFSHEMIGYASQLFDGTDRGEKLRFWITDHTALPTFNYADSYLRSRTMAKWYPDDRHWKEMEERLIMPDPALLEAIVAEKHQAVAKAHRRLVSLEAVRPNLQPEQYADLYWSGASATIPLARRVDGLAR
jgi:hypothetical protein